MNYLKIMSIRGGKLRTHDLFVVNDEDEVLERILRAVKRYDHLTQQNIRVASYAPLGGALSGLPVIGIEGGTIPLAILERLPSEPQSAPAKVQGKRRLPARTVRILRFLREHGSSSRRDIIEGLKLRRGLSHHTLYSWKKMGLIEQTNETRRGAPALWGVTEEGEARCG